MRQSKRWVCAIIAAVMFVVNARAAFSSAPSDTPSVISARSRGDEVVQIQMRLRDLGYLNYKITGQFGDVTIDALTEFQRVNGLTPDGVAGEETLQALFANNAKRSFYDARQAAATPTPKPTPSPTPEPTERRTEKPTDKSKDTDKPKDTPKKTDKPDTDKPKKTTAKPEDTKESASKKTSPPKKTEKPEATKKPKATSATVNVKAKEPAPGHGKLLSWSTVNSMWSRGSTCLVEDFRTGTQYYMYRMGGSNHADVEPKTADDTRKFKNTYGGSWSWDRRPVLVRIDGQWVAGSANGQPHGKDTISGNDMSGQVCIHFLNSRTHVHNAVDSDHKRCIYEAAGQ